LDPELLGVSIVAIQGMGFVRSNVVRDLAALNRCEVLPWDEWGLAEPPLDDLGKKAFELLDHIAALEARGGPLEALRNAYDNNRALLVPATVTS
jgi:hypothetical protein